MSKGNDEQQQLLALATKLRMNTTVRRSIFLLVMSSRDVSDAFERLQRLNLKGKQDRDIVRVIVECCGQERTYNAFYSELLSLFCQQNRQFKITIQFAFWDLFNAIESESTSSSGSITSRSIVNEARLLAHLICNFHVHMSIIKPIDMTNLNEKLVLFLATFFMALFSFKV